jgi:hypothetical protein
MVKIKDKMVLLKIFLPELNRSYPFGFFEELDKV